MKHAIAIGTMAVAAFGAAYAAQPAHASYQGLHVQLHTNANVDGQIRSVWRVYALFSDPGDFVTSVAGAPSLGSMHIQSLDSSGQFPGSNFFNQADQPYDTAPAIGVVYDGDFAPQFSSFINGNEFINSSYGWFTTGGTPQGQAANGVADVGGSGNWGVFIMQLTVNAGDHVRGTVAIGGINNNPLAGGTTFQTPSNQTFNSFPAPGSVAVLALAGVVGLRRRRPVES